jgi:hypothetical protein
MKAVNTLPEGYRELLSVDMKKDKKLAVFVNVLSLVIAAILGLPVHFFAIPFTSLGWGGQKAYLIHVAVLFGGMFVYIVLHELVHGIAMKLCGTKKVKYGFTGLYAFAGSDDYYYKKPYIAIALAPIVVWGVILGIVNTLVPVEWFWVVYFIQLINLSGAAGDLYVTCRFAGLPKDVLIRDYGVSMTVYARGENGSAESVSQTEKE